MSFNRCDFTFVKNPKIIPKLSEVLDLILQKTKSHSKTVTDVYYFNDRSFKESPTFGKKSVSLINECLLNHRFEEASKLLWIMYQDRTCFDLIFYKGIMVVLENLIPDDDIETVKKILRDIRKLKFVNKLEIQLEYLIYALKNDIHGVESSFYLEDKNTKKWKTRIIPYIEQIYSAYCALVNYITWVNITRGEETCPDETDIASSIILSFKQLISNPGIWDIFVLKLIELLEYYGQCDEIEEVLKKYIERNPQHVNAYVYLCVHLHKHNADKDTLIRYGKALHDLCPSDERVLLLVQQWNEQGNHLKKRLRILFMFLDYPVNGKNLLGWKLLFSVLYQAVSSKKSSSMMATNSFWKFRRSSWNYIHFKSSSVPAEPLELILCKVNVLSILEYDHGYIIYVQENFLQSNKEHLAYGKVSLPTPEDFRSLYSQNDTRTSDCL